MEVTRARQTVVEMAEATDALVTSLSRPIPNAGLDFLDQRAMSLQELDRTAVAGGG